MMMSANITNLSWIISPFRGHWIIWVLMAAVASGAEQPSHPTKHNAVKKLAV
jgi:hypothetical protein